MARRPAKSTYPARGTPAGDESVGACSACEASLCRGDAFVAMMGGKLVCLPCHCGYEIKPPEPKLGEQAALF